MYHTAIKYLTIILREVNEEDNHKTDSGTVYQQINAKLNARKRDQKTELRYGGEDPHWTVVVMKKKRRNKRKKLHLHCKKFLKFALLTCYNFLILHHSEVVPTEM